ncbi:TonB-dependent receptor [Janthinobacterium fluminis]|uniref:TonB-dependent receptor n=1 Tax=Janthinobacterium fluminis TaxID=2987524 RepID=A0ABT5K454_9BURK|nr:TonB-dependent receptor [Janthinobacterium fluminis]MDC8759531.1 TonB-dependent receptor [Janthinobacterium fluminis]
MWYPVLRRLSGAASPALLSAAAALAAAHPVSAQETGAALPDAGTVLLVGKRSAGTGPYRVDSVGLGPLGQRAWLDTPHAVSVVPAELIENQQMKSVRDAFRHLPSVQGENVRPQTRGLQAGVVQNTRIDGMNIAATTDYPAEQFERIEVLNGLAGALYGPANPAGTFNYVLKRPTAAPLRRLSVGYASAGGLLAHADLGGSFGAAERFGYRLNLLDDSGEGYVDGSRLRRRLASVAIDARLGADTVLETNASTYRYLRKGYAGTFLLANKVDFPAAPDPTRPYGQTYAGDDNVTDTVSARLRQGLGGGWYWRGGVQRQIGRRASTAPSNTLTSNAGNYTTTAATTTYSRDTIGSYTFALDGQLQAGGLAHQLVLASTGFGWDRYTPYNTAAITLGSASLERPQPFKEPQWPDFGKHYRSVHTRQQTLTLGDTVRINARWSATLAASQSWIEVSNFNKLGATTSRYSGRGLSPAASVMFKPLPAGSVYLSYADSLQQGDGAPSGTRNAGENLAPYRSKQWEAGYKQQWRELNLSATVFRIARPFAATDPSDQRYKLLGEQINRGLELGAAGAATPQLNVFAGLTLLDARLRNAGQAGGGDKQILGLARRVASAVADYRLGAVPGLFLSVSVSGTGRRPGNNSNSTWVSGYGTADLGLRYAGAVLGQAATWRLALNNVGDRRYWANIAPGGQNGYSGTGNGTGTLGAPRTVQASLQMNL